MSIKRKRIRILFSLVCGATLALGAGYGAGENLFAILGVKRVLLISIDGMHSLDLALYVKSHPASTLASLVATGVNYTNASSTRPTDSIASTSGMVTGGSPAVTGMYYDDAYNRALSPAGSKCATIGTAFSLKQDIDVAPTALNTTIDPTKLPLDPGKGCTPVYPHNMIRVNTIFEVVKAAGLHTAYSEKRPSYDFLNGPSGTGVDDLYTPEINYLSTLTSNTLTQQFDELRVQSILHEIDGFDHTGVIPTPTPALFGMNFQSINAGKKNAPGGYSDSLSTPTVGVPGAPALADQLDYVDGALGRMVAELKAKNLFNSTAIIVTAKHAETALDPNHRQVVLTSVIPALVDGNNAHVTQKSNALIWLKNQSLTNSFVTSVLTTPANQAAAGIGQVLSGESLKLLLPDPLLDPVTPDIVVVGAIGVNYEPSGSTVLAEHGGFAENDTHVPLVVSVTGFTPITVKAPVEITQIAPTILTLLKLNPLALQAVVAEETGILPNILF